MFLLLFSALPLAACSETTKRGIPTPSDGLELNETLEKDGCEDGCPEEREEQTEQKEGKEGKERGGRAPKRRRELPPKDALPKPRARRLPAEGRPSLRPLPLPVPRPRL